MTAVRRQSPARNIRVSGLASAADTIGPITPGCEILGLTNGQFSLIDIIEHVLTEIGPADVAISTWTMGVYDADQADAFVRNGAIRSIRWVVDPSMFNRRPELAGRLIAAFGIEAFRAVSTHAKFAILANERFSIVVRSSMNLNRNDRLENYEISDSPAIAVMFLRVVDDVFAGVPIPGIKPPRAKATFAAILAKYEAAAVSPSPTKQATWEKHVPRD